MNALTASIGAAGESLAAATSGKSTTGTRTRYGTVAANNGTTLDVTLSGGTLAALPMTADCVGAAAGDRVAVSVDGPLATVTGIVATSDTGGYDIFAGTKVINTSSSNALFTDAEFKAAFGRSFSQATDCIVGMNGDSVARSGKTCDLSYNPTVKVIYLEGVGAVGLYRVNYILAMPSGSTRTVAQGVASATSRATTAAEAANEAAEAATKAITGVGEATDKANAAAEAATDAASTAAEAAQAATSAATGVTEATGRANAAAEAATTAAGKVDGAITEATAAAGEAAEAATKATDAAAGAEGAASNATTAASTAADSAAAATTAAESATTAATTATEAADGAAKVNATLDGTKLTVTDRTGASTTIDTKGIQGEQGPKGDKGDKGATGDKGDKGDKGEPGEVTLAYLKSYAEPLQEAEYDRQVARGTYAGRSIQTILGCSTWEDTYAALHAKVAAADFSGLRVGDYLDVTFTGTDLITKATQRFVLAHFDPDYNTGGTALTTHHLAFVAQNPVAVASGAIGCINTSRIQWSTTATNNGTAAQPAPYMGSTLHAFEAALAAELPDSISGYVISRTARLETRYSASGTLTNGTGTGWYDLGKVWSMSQYEAFGENFVATRIYGLQAMTFGLSRLHLRTAGDWWLRDVYGGNSTNAAYANQGGYVAGGNVATQTWCRPRPCFLFA